MLNRTVQIGRLTKKPELRKTESGKAVTTMRIAVDNTFDKDADADFFDVVVWEKAAESCCKYLDKGRLIAVDGHLKSRTWEDKEGVKRYTVDIVADTVTFLPSGGKKDEE